MDDLNEGFLCMVSALAFRMLVLILSAALSSLVQNGTRPYWKKLMDWMLSLAITGWRGAENPEW